MGKETKSRLVDGRKQEMKRMQIKRGCKTHDGNSSNSLLFLGRGSPTVGVVLTYF